MNTCGPILSAFILPVKERGGEIVVVWRRWVQLFGEIGWLRGWGEIRSLMSYYVEEQVSEESTCHMSYEGHVNTLYLRRM